MIPVWCKNVKQDWKQFHPISWNSLKQLETIQIHSVFWRMVRPQTLSCASCSRSVDFRASAAVFASPLPGYKAFFTFAGQENVVKMLGKKLLWWLFKVYVVLTGRKNPTEFKSCWVLSVAFEFFCSTLPTDQKPTTQVRAKNAWKCQGTHQVMSLHIPHFMMPPWHVLKKTFLHGRLRWQAIYLLWLIQLLRHALQGRSQDSTPLENSQGIPGKRGRKFEELGETWQEVLGELSGMM